MKVLCTCENGNSRSVALAYILKRQYGFDALAMGLHVSMPQTKDMLFDWADQVVLTDATLIGEIPNRVLGKLKIYDVGEDRYFKGFKRELLDQFRQYLENDPLELA